MKNDLADVSKYPQWRLRFIVEGHPLDWDDNVSVECAKNELKRRSDLGIISSNIPGEFDLSWGT